MHASNVALEVDSADMAPIKAVYDDQLAEFLNSIGLLRQFESGRILCHFCNTVVDEENLLAVFPEDNTIHVACDRLSCQEALGDLDLA